MKTFEKPCTRELFNGSNGSASLPGCTGKKFLVWGCGFFVIPDNSIQYFSDGCTGQYKNMLNLFPQIGLQHGSFLELFRHSPQAMGNLHVMVLVARLAARASLQRPLADQILRPQALFEYCKCNIEGIEFIYILKVT